MAARRYGRRLRRGAAGTAVAAAAMAALSASQAPGFLPAAHADSQPRSTAVTPPPGPEIDGGSPYITEVPPLNIPTGPVAPTTPGTTPGDGPTVTVPGGGADLPTTVLDAYLRAQRAVAVSDPGCHLPWELLAAIGQVESGQARGGSVDANGTTSTPVLGPVLDGNGFANISDTDGGAYDGDATYDRAVGPMQFIPSTWQRWGADGNGDGASDPNNVYDAALAAAHYLCADGRDLAVPRDMDRAILGYNHSQAYLKLVKAWYEHFRQGGAVAVADRAGAPGPGVTPPPTAPGSPSPSPSAPGTPTTGPTGTPSPGGAHTPVPSPTIPAPTTTVPGTSPSPTTSPTPTVSPSPTTSPSPSEPATTTPSPTPTPSPTSTQCPTPGPTPSPSDSATATPSPEPTTTPSPDPDPCATPSPSPAPSDSPSPSSASSPSPSPSETGAGATGSAVTPSA